MILNPEALEVVQTWLSREHRRTDVILIYVTQLALATLILIILTHWTRRLLTLS